MSIGLKTSTADNQLKHNGGSGTSSPSYVKVPEYTILADSFTLNNTTGLYEYIIEDKAITENNIVNINIAPDSTDVAIDAELSSVVTSISGGVKITSKKEPKSNIVCSYIVF